MKHAHLSDILNGYTSQLEVAGRKGGTVLSIEEKYRFLEENGFSRLFEVLPVEPDSTQYMGSSS